MKSARTTLGLGLDAFARLLAPFLPYTTEEVWSWMHAGEGSVHHAPWPKPITYATAAFKARRSCSRRPEPHSPHCVASVEAKVSMKTPILSVMLNVNDELHDALAPALGDIAEAARVTGRISLQKASDLMASSPSEGRGHGSTGPGIGRDGRRGDHRGRKRARRATGQETEGRAVSANPGNEMREGMSMCLPHFVFRRRHARDHLLFVGN